MNIRDKYKDGKKIKEIDSIIYEKNEIQRLLREGHWEELDMQLQKLKSKYFTETIIYNTVNTNPPQNLQENAQNCISFLDTLFIDKMLKNNID